MIRRAACAAAVALAGSLPSAALAEETPPEAFRATFDPASRVGLSFAETSRWTDGEREPRFATEVGFGLAYLAVYQRSGRDTGHWMAEHRGLTGWTDVSHEAGRTRSFEVQLYRLTVLRHSLSPSLVLPTSPPVTVPFPFDVGADLAAGRVGVPAGRRTARDGRAVTPFEIGVAEAAWLVDPIRSGHVGRRFTLGAGLRYDIDAVSDGVTVTATHRIAPFTAGSARLHLEDDDGLTALDLAGEVVPHWTEDGAFGVLADASLHVERVLIAVNDEPLVATLDGTYRRRPEGGDLEALNEVRVSLGVTIALSLR